MNALSFMSHGYNQVSDASIPELFIIHSSLNFLKNS